MQIGTQKNGEWQKCEMADYLYSVAIQANLFHNNIADKMVWRIDWGWINEYSLYYNKFETGNAVRARANWVPSMYLSCISVCML